LLQYCFSIASALLQYCFFSIASSVLLTCAGFGAAALAVAQALLGAAWAFGAAGPRDFAGVEFRGTDAVSAGARVLLQMLRIFARTFRPSFRIVRPITVFLLNIYKFGNNIVLL
jgi:hypothetical protein